ncbi:MAG: PQQ-binding-like beta-propeller repeat protein [Pirellulales bacterium]
MKTEEPVCREIWAPQDRSRLVFSSLLPVRGSTRKNNAKRKKRSYTDAETGKDGLSHEYEARFWDGIAGAGPRATPTITPDGIYATGADGAVMRLRPEDGKEFWQHHFKEDAGRAKAPEWGYASSPLVIGNKAIVHAGGKEDKGIIAYNAQDGSIAWTAAAGNHSYSSPQIAEFAGVRGVLMLCNDMLQFVNPEDGKQLWAYPWKVDTYRALQPLVVGTDIYLATPLSSGMHKISVHLVDGQWKVEKQWDTRGLKPDFNDYVELDGMIYGFDSNIFGCIDAATGKRKWKQGRYGNGQVLLIADSKQLLLTSETGELVLLNADPEKLDERAKFPVFTSKTWNHPVLIGNRLYLRNAEEAACLELPVTLTNSADAGQASPPAS